MKLSWRLSQVMPGTVVRPPPRGQIITLAYESVPMTLRTNFVFVSPLSSKVSLRG